MEKKYTFNAAAFGAGPYQIHAHLLDLLNDRLHFWQNHYRFLPSSKNHKETERLFKEEFPGLVYNTMLFCGMTDKTLSQTTGLSLITIKDYKSGKDAPASGKNRAQMIAALHDIAHTHSRNLKRKMKQGAPSHAGETPRP